MKEAIQKLKNQLFVLDCKLSTDDIERNFPHLDLYLKEGIEQGVSKRYLCKSRKIWYSQENRVESKFYCTYIGRLDKKGRKAIPFYFKFF